MINILLNLQDYKGLKKSYQHIEYKGFFNIYDIQLLHFFGIL